MAAKSRCARVRYCAVTPEAMTYERTSLLIFLTDHAMERFDSQRIFRAMGAHHWAEQADQESVRTWAFAAEAAQSPIS